MGRVDEALRRAAEGQKQGDAAVAVPPGQGGDALGHEAFPLETPDRPRPRAITPVTPISFTEVPEPAAAEAIELQTAEPQAAEAHAVEPQAAEPVDHEPGVPGSLRGAGRSLFERLDARVAGKIVVDQEMLPASREQYRRLAAALHHAQAARDIKVVMIASAVAAEGKSLTASNLALTLSESYDRTVLLIDADLRRPTLHTVFKISGSPGLSEGLFRETHEKLPVHPVTRNLTVLPSGQPSADPMAGLTSPRMRHLIDEARAEFDWVIIDTPPVALLTDANLLASMVDGAILVVRAGETPYDMVQRAVAALGAGRMLGVVLNGADANNRAYGYDYYSSYHTAPPAPSK